MFGIFLEYETLRMYDALNDVERHHNDLENGENIFNDQAAHSMLKVSLKLLFALALVGICILPG